MDCILLLCSKQIVRPVQGSIQKLQQGTQSQDNPKGKNNCFFTSCNSQESLVILICLLHKTKTCCYNLYSLRYLQVSPPSADHNSRLIKVTLILLPRLIDMQATNKWWHAEPYLSKNSIHREHRVYCFSFDILFCSIASHRNQISYSFPISFHPSFLVKPQQQPGVVS